MKELILLISKASYLPMSYSKDDEQLLWPRALRLLPLWGLIAGLILVGSFYLLRVFGMAVAASSLLIVDVLFASGVYLKDIINFADGIDPHTDNSGATSAISETKVKVGYPGIIAAIAFLLIKYGVYCLFIKYYQLGIYLSAIPAAAIFSRWIYVWLVYDFATWGTNQLHQSFRREDFLVASLLALTIVIFLTNTILWPTLLISLFAVYFWALIRKKQGGMYPACYGALLAWSEALFSIIYIFLWLII